MTDGPFKNAALTARWKRFGNALENDAMSSDDRSEWAESALSKDLSKEFRALVQELNHYVKQPQTDEAPRSTVMDIFDRHASSPLADTLQRFFLTNLERPISRETAFTRALDSTIRREQDSIRSRMVEEAMLARDRTHLKSWRFPTVIHRLDEAIENMSLSKMREDVLTNKAAPKAALVKKTGIDDGPRI